MYVYTGIQWRVPQVAFQVLNLVGLISDIVVFVPFEIVRGLGSTEPKAKSH